MHEALTGNQRPSQGKPHCRGSGFLPGQPADLSKLTTAWNIEAERSFVAPSLIRGWISDLQYTAARLARRRWMVIVFRVFVLVRMRLSEAGGHLVNKKSRSPGADSVHPLIDTTGEINNFSIFSRRVRWRHRSGEAKSLMMWLRQLPPGQKECLGMFGKN